MNTIAILIPIYNGVEFFDDAFESVRNQSYSAWQLWIGINGHLCNSAIWKTVHDKCKQYGKTHDINILDLGKVGGKSQALNAMITYLPDSIEYIALLDVDDIWAPQKLAMQMPYVGRGFDVVGGKCQYFGDKDIIPPVPLGAFSKAQFNFKSSNPVINSSVVLRKSLAYWDPHWEGLEDYHLWLRIQDRRFFNVPVVLVKHRIHGESAFNGTNKDRTAELLATF